MNALKVRKNWMVAILALVIAGLFALPLQSALASDGTFKVSVYHNINGRTLDLPKDLPVDVVIYNNGAYLITIEDFMFKDRVNANLPAGTYDIYVYLDQSLGGGLIPSMTIRGAEIPEGVEVRLQANLGPGQTPRIMVKVK
jgi:hypothetical protein